MSNPISAEKYAENSGKVGITEKADKVDRQEVLYCKKTFTMKNVLTAIIIGMFALISHLTAEGLSSANSNDLNNNPQIEVQLNNIECLSNQQLPGTFRLKLHAGSVEIYNEIIDFSVGSRITSEDIPNARVENLDIFDAELFITIKAIDSGISESQSIGILEVGKTFDFDVILHLQQSNQSSGIIVQGSIRVVE